MDSTAIKLEPGTSAEESVAVTFTEIDIEYPFIKNEHMEFISENHSGERSSSDSESHRNFKSEFIGIIGNLIPDGVTNKASEISFNEIEREIPNIKNERFEPSDRIHQSLDNFKAETVTFRLDPESREKDGQGISYMEIDIEVPGVKKESLKPSQGITQTTDTSTDLKTHPMEKSFHCPHCNYSCFYKSKLVQHFYTHSGEKLYSCPVCSYSCSHKHNLTVHMRTHNGEKPFSCSDCSYSCSRKGNLTKHMLTHRREKSFTCSDCNYSCSQREYMKKHKLTHKGEKTFSCSDCKYSCSRKGYLMSHMMTHSGEKPFSCTDCSYSSSRKSSLKRHMLTHSGEKPFSCTDCNYSCTQRGHLAVHMMTHSGEKRF